MAKEAVAKSSWVAFMQFGAKHGTFAVAGIGLFAGGCAATAAAWGSHVSLKLQVEHEKALREEALGKEKALREEALGKEKALREEALEKEKALRGEAVEKARREVADKFLQLGFTAEYEKYQKRLGIWNQDESE